MQKKTLSHISMYQNVLAVVNDHQTVWNGVQSMVTAVDELNSLLNTLENKLNLQSTITQGIRLEKEAYLKALTEDISILKNALFLYATETNDLVLRERNRDSRTTLTHLSANRLQVISIALLEDLQTHGAELGTVGISAEQIQQFQLKVTDLENRKNSVRQAIIQRTLETKAIGTLEKQINRLLIDRLDRFLSLFKAANGSFVAKYKAARKVIETNGHAGPKPNKTVAE